MDGSCTTSQGRVVPGGGEAGSIVISNFMHLLSLGVLGAGWALLSISRCWCWKSFSAISPTPFHLTQGCWSPAGRGPSSATRAKKTPLSFSPATPMQRLNNFSPTCFPWGAAGLYTQRGGEAEPALAGPSAGAIPAIRLLRMWREWESRSSVLTQRFVNESLWSQADFPVLFLDVVRITEGCRFWCRQKGASDAVFLLGQERRAKRGKQGNFQQCFWAFWNRHR